MRRATLTLHVLGRTLVLARLEPWRTIQAMNDDVDQLFGSHAMRVSHLLALNMSIYYWEDRHDFESLQ